MPLRPWLLLCAASCAAASPLPASPAGVTPESITVTSRTFDADASIPIDQTCDGSDTPPDVTWSSPPEGTKSLVITLEDLEAPGGPSTHWLVMDVSPDARSLKAGADPSTVGANVGKNDSGAPGYKGPCPPRHEGHHYALRVIALDKPLKLDESANREAANAAMEGHVLGSGQVVGTVFR